MTATARNATLLRKLRATLTAATLHKSAVFALSASTCLIAPAYAESYKFSSVEISGNARIEPRTILSLAGIARGQAVSAGELNDAYQRLQGSGLFERVDLTPKGAKLVITVVEYPTVNVVAFEGNKKMKDEALAEIVKTQSRKVYSPAAVEADAAALTKAYSDMNRLAATVTPKVIARDGNRVDVVYEITEGKVAEVERISITGNRAFSDRRLRNALDSKQAGVFRSLVQRDTLVPARLDYDAQLLADFYRERGYIDVKVRGVSSEYARERDGFFITFNVEEGQKYAFNRATVVSEIEGVNPADYQNQIRIKAGSDYTPNAINLAVTRMEGVALKAGLTFVSIEPELIRDEAKQLIDVRFVIKRGARTFVERIDIEGNSTTRDDVIRREFNTVEGDPFSAREIRNAKARIEGLGFFAKTDVEARTGTSAEQVVVDVNVEEQSTGTFGVGATYGVSAGLGANISLDESNFLGRGQAVGIAIASTSDTRDNSLSFVEPYLLGRDLTFRFNVKNSKTDNSNALYQTETDQIQPGIEFPVSEQMRLALSYTIKSDRIFNVGEASTDAVTGVTTYSGSSPILERDEDMGRLLTSGIGYTLSYDTRINALDPSTNYLVTFGQTYNGLGGDVDALITRASATAQTKVMHEEVTLKAELEGGALKMLNGQRSRVVDRFSGNGLIRGFEAYGYGPRDTGATVSDGLGGNYYAALRTDAQFPIGLPEEYGILGGIFWDIGTVWGLDDTAGAAGEVDDSLSLRSAIGASIYWDTAIGPLRLNFSRPIKKLDTDIEQNFDLTISTKF